MRDRQSGIPPSQQLSFTMQAAEFPANNSPLSWAKTAGDTGRSGNQFGAHGDVGLENARDRTPLLGGLCGFNELRLVGSRNFCLHFEMYRGDREARVGL